MKTDFYYNQIKDFSAAKRAQEGYKDYARYLGKLRRAFDDQKSFSNPYIEKSFGYRPAESIYDQNSGKLRAFSCQREGCCFIISLRDGELPIFYKKYKSNGDAEMLSYSEMQRFVNILRMELPQAELIKHAQILEDVRLSVFAEHRENPIEPYKKTLHDQGRFFGPGTKEDYKNFLQNIMAGTVEEHAACEAALQDSLFSSLAAVLGQAEHKEKDSRNLSAEGLKRNFMLGASAHQCVMMGMPVYISEYFANADAPSVSVGDNKERSQVKYIHIETNEKSKRIFDTAKFGFISLTGRNKTFTQSFVGLPCEPLTLLDSYTEANDKTLLRELSNLYFLINHDVFHGLTMDLVNRDITQIPFTAPATKHFDAHLIPSSGSEIIVKGDLSWAYDSQTLNSQKYVDYLMREKQEKPLESWSMRIHRLALTHMASVEGNPLTQSLNGFLKAWKKLKTETEFMEPMKDPQMKFYQYVFKLMAYNLIRALPKDHPQVQAILNDPDVGADRVILDDLYEIPFIKYVLHGPGKEFYGKEIDPEWVRELDKVIIDMTRHALMISYRDSHRAMAKDGRREACDECKFMVGLRPTI